MHHGPPAPAQRSSSTLGIVALLSSLAGTVVFPALSLLVAHVGGRDARDWLAAPLVVGALVVVAAVVLAIVALVRGRGRIPAIVALVLGVLSVPVGYVAYAIALVMAKGGALV